MYSFFSKEESAEAAAVERAAGASALGDGAVPAK
jgi:hypothetical protein